MVDTVSLKPFDRQFNIIPPPSGLEPVDYPTQADFQAILPPLPPLHVLLYYTILI